MVLREGLSGAWVSFICTSVYFRNGLYFWTNNVECVYYEVRSDAGTRRLTLLSAV